VPPVFGACRHVWRTPSSRPGVRDPASGDGKAIKKIEQQHDFEQNQKLRKGEITQEQLEPFSPNSYHCVEVFNMLHTPQVNWCRQASMAAACHKVGLTRPGPCLEAVPPQRLLDDEAGTPAAVEGASPDTTPETESNAATAAILFTAKQNLAALPTFTPPADCAPGSVEYLTAKLEWSEARRLRVEKLYSSPQTAAEAGTFHEASLWHSNQPKNFQTKRLAATELEGDQHDQFGKMRKRQRLEQEKAAAAAVAVEQNRLVAVFNFCRPTCACGTVPCKAAKIKYCKHCASSGRCGVRMRKCTYKDCKAAAAAEEALAAAAAAAARALLLVRTQRS
jgi:hypothetical protein